MTFLTLRRTALVAAATLLVSALAACSGPAAQTPSADATGTPEKAAITVAINSSSQFAPMYYGIAQGIFEKHGLTLNIVPQTDVAAIVSGIASGTYDFGFGTVVHVDTANANGIPIRAVSTIEGQIQPNDEGTITIASPGSGIKNFAGLSGKRVATVGLSSHNTLTLWELAKRAGVDPTTITLVQMPFGQMAAALAKGDVDAAVMQWPFAADALSAGGVALGYNNREIFNGAATTLFNTSQNFIDQNPKTVRAFSDAMIESIEGASAHQDQARAALQAGMSISAAQAAAARWNIGGDPHVTLAGFETARDLLVKYSTDQSLVDGLKNLDVKTVVWPGALQK